MMHATRKAPISAKATHAPAACLPVIPAQAGIHAAFPYGTAGDRFLGRCRPRAFTSSRRDADSAWISAFAGMTKEATGMTKVAEMVMFAVGKGSDNEGCRQ